MELEKELQEEQAEERSQGNRGELRGQEIRGKDRALGGISPLWQIPLRQWYRSLDVGIVAWGELRDDEDRFREEERGGRKRLRGEGVLM